jgi:hypothetical protein
MAKKNLGSCRHTTSVPPSESSPTTSGGATGTATTTSFGPLFAIDWTAALTEFPVAMPSSTTSTVLPSRFGYGRSPLRLFIRSSTSNFFRCASSSRYSEVAPTEATARSSTITSPSWVTAPSANSGSPGAPIFLVTTMSSGASRASATSLATTTPPLGIPSTTTSFPLNPARARARR